MNAKQLVTLTIALILSAAMTAVSAFAEMIDLSTGVAVLANGKDANGNDVVMYNPAAHANRKMVENTPSGETSGNHINDVDGDGYADMMRTTRNTDEADKYFVNNPKYAGVIDWGVTRDANWTTVYTVADTGTGAPGIASSSNWGSAARQADIASFLRNTIGNAATGFIDNYIVEGTWKVMASTAELYGTTSHSGTNYNQGGLSNIATGPYGGVIGQSGGYYFDEAGQYELAADGTLTFQGNGWFTTTKNKPDTPFEEKYGSHLNPDGLAIYDDWNQHGLVTTGLDLIAYVTNFNAAGGISVISGQFNVLGAFLDIYINGNKIAHDLLGLTEYLYGTGNIVGEYSFNLDLSLLDASWYDAEGANNIAFMVRTVSPWELGLEANSTGYAKEAGFNYFSGDIQASTAALVPEPATILLVGLGLIGLGYARRRKAK